MTKHPMQPIYLAPDKVVRFYPNKIVEYLLNNSSVNLTHISAMVQDAGINAHGFSVQDYSQLMQLIGYSVSGWGDLDCADRRAVSFADKRALKILGEPK